MPMKSGHVVAMSALKGLDLHTGKIISGEGERLLRIERSKDIIPVQPDNASRFPLQEQAWKIRYHWEGCGEPSASHPDSPSVGDDSGGDAADIGGHAQGGGLPSVPEPEGTFVAPPYRPKIANNIFGEGEEECQSGVREVTAMDGPPGDGEECGEPSASYPDSPTVGGDSGGCEADSGDHAQGGGSPSAPEPEGTPVGSPSRPKIAEYTCSTGPTDRFVLPPPSAGICHAAILARTTRNSKSKHEYETKEIMFGLKDSVRKRKLPIAKGERRIIETTVYYGPLYRAPDVCFDIDATSFGVFEDEAGKVRKHRTSNNP